MDVTGFFRRRRERRMFRRFLAEARLRRHADDDLLSAEQRSGLDALIGEAAALPEEKRTPERCAGLDARYRKLLPPYRHRVIREWLDLLAVVGAVAFGIRGLFFQPFRIPTGSMQPTLYGIHFQVREPASNPWLARVPQPLRWLLFSARDARLEIAPPGGRLNEDSIRARSGVLCDDTSFRIGATTYTLPGVPEKVFEYSGLRPGVEYPAGAVPTDGFLSLGDHLFVERFSLYLKPPARGDVMVFNTENLTANGRRLADVSGYYYIKRLVALPGDTLKIVGSQLLIRPAGGTAFVPVQELDPRFEKVYSGRGGYQGHLGFMGEYPGFPGGEYTVPPDSYFMMGDNSRFSLDSRFFGPVPRRNLVGRAWIVFWPFSRRWGTVDTRPPLDVPTGGAVNGTFPVMYRQ